VIQTGWMKVPAGDITQDFQFSQQAMHTFINVSIYHVYCLEYESCGRQLKIRFSACLNTLSISVKGAGYLVQIPFQ
jgi:hypothetical protein